MDIKSAIALCTPPGRGRNHGAGDVVGGFPKVAFHAQHAPTGQRVNNKAELDQLVEGWQVRELTDPQNGD